MLAWWQVKYLTDEFIAKNMDAVVPEHEELLKKSSNEFIAAMFPDNPEAAGAPTKGPKFTSIGKSFKVGMPGAGLSCTVQVCLRSTGDLLRATAKGPRSSRCVLFCSFHCRVQASHLFAEALYCLRVVCPGSQQQLGLLMETLNATEPHYIRCIKPNSKSRPMLFEKLSVMEQLRSGVRNPMSP